MGLFSKKARPAAPVAGPVVAVSIGRKLRTAGSLAEAEANFRVLAAAESSLLGEDIFFTPTWGDPESAPDLLLAAQVTSASALYMAGWDRGGHRELHVVPPDYPSDGVHPLFGAWKMRDRSLASIGGVTHFPVADA